MNSFLNSFLRNSSTPPAINAHLEPSVGNPNPLNLYQRSQLSSKETLLASELNMNSLIDRLDPRRINPTKGSSPDKKLIQDTLTETEQENFRNTIRTMNYNDPEVANIRAKQGAALANMAFSTFPTDINSLMGSTLQAVKGMINRFDIGIQNLDPLDASAEQKKRDYNQFVSSTVYRYMFEPLNGRDTVDPLNPGVIDSNWKGLMQGVNVRGNAQVTGSEIRGLEVRETWLRGRVSVSENKNVERIRRIHDDIRALSLGFNPYTDDVQIERIDNRATLGQKLLTSANNVLNRMDYMSKLGIEPMVNLIYTARTELTIDAFQLQNAAIVEVLIDKLRSEKDRIAKGEFKFNLRLAYPSDQSKDLTGLRILGPNMVVLERLRMLKEEAVNAATSPEDKARIESNFGINYTTANYHTKIYTSDSYAMLGSFNATSPVGNSIRMAGSNYEEVFIFRNYDNKAPLLGIVYDSEGNPLRDKETGDFIYEEGALEYVFRGANPMTAKQSAHTKLYRQTRLMQESPSRFSGASGPISEVDRFANIGGAVHAGNALRDAVTLVSKDKNNRLFMNLNQVWLLQYSDGLFSGSNILEETATRRGEGGLQSSFSEFGTDYYSDSVGRTDKVIQYRSIQDNLFDLLVNDRAQITVDTHTYEDKVLKPLMSQVTDHLNTKNVDFYSKFDADLGRLGVLNKAGRDVFGSSLGAMGSLDRKYQAMAYNLFGAEIDTATLNVLSKNVYDNITASDQQALSKLGGQNTEENLNRLRVLKQIAAVTSGNISLTTQTMQHVKNLAVFDFSDPEGKMIFSQAGSSNYGLSSLDFSDRQGNLLGGGGIRTSHEVSYTLSSEQARQRLGTQEAMQHARDRNSVNLLLQEEEDAMREEHEITYRREWNNLSNRRLDSKNNMLHATKATWESQVKSAKLHQLAEQIESINKALGYTSGEGIQITKSYGQGKDTARLLSLNIKLNTQALTGAKTSNSSMSFRVTAFEDFIYLINQNKLIGKSLFMNASNQDVFMPYGTNTQSKRLAAGQGSELSDVETFTNIMVSMAGEMTYRTFIAAPQEFIHRKATAGTLSNAATRMLESMVFGHSTANSMESLMDLSPYEIKKLHDTFIAKFGLGENIEADIAVGRARDLMRSSQSKRTEGNNIFLEEASARLADLGKTTNKSERRSLIREISDALAAAAQSTSGEHYEVGVAYAMLESHNDFLYQLKIDRDLKTMKTTFFEPYIARQQGSFYANSQTYYRRQVYGVRASNAKMAQSMNLSMNSEEMVGNLAAYWGYARATGFTFSASEDIAGGRGLIRGVAEGGGGRDTGRNTGMSMFGQGQISVADVTGIGLAEDSLVAQYITKEAYIKYVEQMANIFGENNTAVKATKQYLQSNEFLANTFKQDDAVILFTFNTPKKRSQIPQRLKNVIGSKPMFELSPELAYLLNKGDDDYLNKQSKGAGVNAYMDTVVESKITALMQVYARGTGLTNRNIETFIEGNLAGLNPQELKILEGFHSKALNTLDPYFSIGMYNAGSIREYLSPEKVAIIDNLREQLQEEHNLSEADFREEGIGYYMLLTHLKSMDALTVGRKGFTEGRRMDFDKEGKGLKSVVIVQLTGAYTDYFYSNPFYGVDSGLLFGEDSDLRRQVYGEVDSLTKVNELYGRFDRTSANDITNNISKEIGLLNRIDNLTSTARRKGAIQEIYNLIQDTKSPEKYSLATLQTAAAVESLLKLKFGKEKYDKSMASDINLIKEVLGEIASNPLLGLNRNERAGLKAMSAVFERVEKRHKASMLTTSWVNAEGLFLAKRGDVVEFDRHKNKVIVYHQDEESGRTKSEYIVGLDIGIKELTTVVEGIQGTADSRNQLSAILGVVGNERINDNAIKVAQTFQGWYRPAEDSKQLTIRAEQLSGFNPDNQLIWEMSFLRAITPSSGRRNEAASGLFKGVEQQTAEGTLYNLPGAGRGLTYMEYIDLQMARQLTNNSSLTIEELYTQQFNWRGSNRQQEVGVWGQDVARLNRIKGVVNPSNLKSYMYEHGIHIVKDQHLRGALLDGGRGRPNDNGVGVDNSGFLAASLLMSFGDSKDGLGNSMLSNLSESQRNTLYSSFYSHAVQGEYGDWFKGIALQTTIKGAKFLETELDAIRNAMQDTSGRSNDILAKYGLPQASLEIAIDNPNSPEYRNLRDTILGKKLLSDNKQAHFSNVQNVSLGMMAGGIFEAITGVTQGGENTMGLKDMLTALMNSVEQHKDNTFGTVKYNQATTDMATIATAIDIMTQLSISTALVDTPHDINLTDQATVLKLASIMGKKAEELAIAMKPGEEARWAAIQTLIGAAVNATKMIKMYTSTQFSFSKEGIGKKGTGSLEFQHLLDPLYQFESEFYEKGSINAVRKTIATLYSNLSNVATPSIAYGVVQNANSISLTQFTSPFETYKMLSLYKSYTDIDSPHMKEAIRLFNDYEKGRYVDYVDPTDGTTKKERGGMHSFEFVSTLATKIENSGITDKSSITEAYYKLITEGPQSISNRDIQALRSFVETELGNDPKVGEYRNVVNDIAELQRVFTGLQQMSSYEQMNVDKSFGPEVLSEFLKDYGPSKGTVITMPGWNTSVNEATGDIILSLNNAESISSYLPSRQEIQLLGAQYGTFVGEVVTKTLDVIQAYTPGTTMYKLRMKMATAGTDAQLSITEEEAATLKKFYESATTIYGGILDATAEGVTQKAAGAKNSFVGAVTTASGSNLVPQRYVVLAQEALRSAIDSNLGVRTQFLQTITDNFTEFDRLMGTTASTGEPLPASSTTQPIENGLDTQKFKSSLEAITKTGVSARFNRLVMTINKMDFVEMNSRNAISSLHKATNAVKNKSEKEFLRQYINMRQEMLSNDPESTLTKVQEAITGIFGMGLEGKESRNKIDLFNDIPKIWTDKSLRDTKMNRSDLTNLTYAKERRAQEQIIKDKLRGYKEDLELEEHRYKYDREGFGESKLPGELSSQLENSKYVSKLNNLQDLMGHLDTVINDSQRGGLLNDATSANYEQDRATYVREMDGLRRSLGIAQTRLQEVKDSQLDILGVRISHFENEIDTIRGEISRLQNSALGEMVRVETRLTQDTADARGKLDVIRPKMNELSLEVERARKELSRLNADIAGKAQTLNQIKQVMQGGGSDAALLDAARNTLEEMKSNQEKAKKAKEALNASRTELNQERKKFNAVTKNLETANERLETLRNKQYDSFIISGEQFDTIQNTIRDLTDNINFDLTEFTKQDEAGRQHIDLAGIMKLANLGANTGDARNIAQVMAFRSSPIGGTAAATNMYNVIQGVGVINQFARDLQAANNEGRQFVQLSEERSKALSLLNPIGAITTNLGDWDGDPYTFIFASASNMSTQLLELGSKIQTQQALLAAAKGKGVMGKESAETIQKQIDDYISQKGILEAKLSALNDRLQNQDQIVRKDVANYLGLDIRYFDSVENGGWATETVATDVMYTYIEQGRGLFGGLEDQVKTTKEVQSGLSNIITEDVYNNRYLTINDRQGPTTLINKQAAELDSMNRINGLLNDRVDQLREMTNNGSLAIESLSSIERLLVNTDPDDNVRSEFLNQLAINMVATMQEPNEFGETFENFNARLYTVMGINNQALAAANKLISQGSGTHMTETGFSVMNRVMGKAGSDILGKTYNTLVGALYSSAPELAMAGVFENKKFQEAVAQYGDNAPELALDKLNNTVQILSKAREQSAATLGFIKNINQLLRDGIKPKTPGEGQVDSIEELEKAVADMRSADPSAKVEIMNKINRAADNLGPGQGIGLRALTQLNSLINATDGIMSEQELAQSWMGDRAPDTDAKLSVLFGIDTGAQNDQFHKVLSEYQNRVGVDQVNVQSAAALKTSMDLRALVVQYRYSFLDDNAKQSTAANADTIFNKIARDAIKTTQDITQQEVRTSIVNKHVEVFFQDAQNLYTLKQSLSSSEYTDLMTPQTDSKLESARQERLRTYYSIISEVKQQTQTFMGQDGEGLLAYASTERLRQQTVANLNNANAGDNIAGMGDQGALFGTISNLALGGKLTPESLNTMIETLVADANIILGGEGKTKNTSIDVMIANLENSTPGFSSLSPEDKESVVNTLKALKGNEELGKVFSELMETSAADLKANMEATLVNEFNRSINEGTSTPEMTDDMRKILSRQQVRAQHNSTNQVSDLVNAAIVTNYQTQVANAHKNSQSAAIELLAGVGLAAIGMLTQEGSMDEDNIREVAGAALITYAYMKPSLAMTNRVGDRLASTARGSRAKVGAAGAIGGGALGATSGIMFARGIAGAALTGNEEDIGAAALKEVTAVAASTVMGAILDTDIASSISMARQGIMNRVEQTGKLNRLDSAKLKTLSFLEGAKNQIDRINPLAISPITYDDNAGVRAMADGAKGAMISAIIGVMMGKAAGGNKVNYRAIYNERIDSVLANAEEGLANSISAQSKAQQENNIASAIYYSETGEPVQMEYSVIEDYEINTEVDRIRYEGWGADEFLNMYG